MNLWEKIVDTYPELTDADFNPVTGSIKLKDDSDGLGAYIVKWEYSKPIPKGLKIGK
jgi:hypothetical protein